MLAEDRGRLRVVGCVGVLLVTAWWAELYPPRVERWVAVPVATLLGVHLVLGYRGFRWIVTALLVGGAVSISIAVITGRSGALMESLGLMLLGVLTAAAACLLAGSGDVRDYLADRRDCRTHGEAVFVAGVWIVVGAVGAVLSWVAVWGAR